MYHLIALIAGFHFFLLYKKMYSPDFCYFFLVLAFKKILKVFQEWSFIQHRFRVCAKFIGRQLLLKFFN